MRSFFQVVLLDPEKFSVLGISGNRWRRKRSKRNTRSATCTDAGLTLIELLVVLSILALVATIAAPQVLRYLGTAKTSTARAQLNNISSALELYYLDVNDYPSNEVGLKALIGQPPQVSRWNGPYIKREATLIDPWGHAYGYRFPNDDGDFEIFSLGRDGKPGGTGEDADITIGK